jgi:membrane protein YqaA with SNARE-associated domain
MTGMREPAPGPMPHQALGFLLLPREQFQRRRVRARAFFGSVGRWLESFSQKPHARWLLFCVAFAEASLLPVSVDIPLVAIGIAAPETGLVLGAIATAGSFLGGFLGYFIGFSLFDLLGRPLLALCGATGAAGRILALYHDHGLAALVLSGFTPLPYISYTYAAGIDRTLDLWTLTLGALLGRTLRFFPIGVLIYVAGSRAKEYLQRYFAAISLTVVLLFTAAYLAYQWLR